MQQFSWSDYASAYPYSTQPSLYINQQTIPFLSARYRQEQQALPPKAVSTPWFAMEQWAGVVPIDVWFAAFAHMCVHGVMQPPLAVRSEQRLVFESKSNRKIFRYATGNDGCLFWAASYADDVGYLLAFRAVVALLVQYVQPEPPPPQCLLAFLVILMECRCILQRVYWADEAAGMKTS